MKRLTCIFLLIGALCLCGCASLGGSHQEQETTDFRVEVADSSKKVVAVLYFDNNTGQQTYDPLGKGLADMMISDLSGVPVIQLVERAHLQKLIEELELQQSAYFDPETAQDMGHMVGAEYVVTGALTGLLPEIRIDARVVRVETSEIVKTAHATGAEKEFFKLQQALSTELIDGLAPALSPEVRDSLRQRREQNRIRTMKTALAYSEALDLFDQEMYVESLVKMNEVRQAAPQSLLVQLTYEKIEREAKQAGKERLNEKVNAFIDDIFQ